MGSEEEREMRAMKRKIEELERKLASSSTPIPPPKFDGKRDFYSFLRDFNVFATAMGWQATDCVRMLPLCLESEAKEIYMNLDPDKKKTWRDLTEAMAEQIKKFDPVSTARRMLAKTKKGAESLTQFANKIRDLVEEAYPDPDFGQNSRMGMAKDHFVEGLPTSLKRKMFYMEKPTDLENALAMAKQVSQINEELDREDQDKIAHLEMAEMKAQINAISAKIEERSENKRGRWNGRWRGGRQWNRSWRGNNQFGSRNNANFTPIGRGGRGNWQFNEGNGWRGGNAQWRGNFQNNFRERRGHTPTTVNSNNNCKTIYLHHNINQTKHNNQAIHQNNNKSDCQNAHASSQNHTENNSSSHKRRRNNEQNNCKTNTTCK